MARAADALEKTIRKNCKEHWSHWNGNHHCNANDPVWNCSRLLSHHCKNTVTTQKEDQEMSLCAVMSLVPGAIIIAILGGVWIDWRFRGGQEKERARRRSMTDGERRREDEEISITEQSFNI